ncbi:hypothetical protein, partial [Klebsiella pneumoniae]|uniref:hypothetical protein n=1 Tax=Klebsiella pneumoniae TaxID=573 RepID=UPI002161F32E
TTESSLQHTLVQLGDLQGEVSRQLEYSNLLKTHLSDLNRFNTETHTELDTVRAQLAATRDQLTDVRQTLDNARNEARDQMASANETLAAIR